MNTYNISQYDIAGRTPKTFYICGSNDGNIWNPIHSATVTTNPYSGTHVYLGTAFNVSTGGTQNTYTCTTYSSSGNPYSYFRLVVNAIFANDNTYTVVADWLINFSVATQTGPSRAVLYMDASNINQLDVSGSLAVVNTNPSTMTVTPNTTAAKSYTWQNNNITWVASSTTATGTGGDSFAAFNMNYLSAPSLNAGWSSVVGSYNIATGVYAGSNSTTVSGSSINGDWLQIQSSVPVVLKNYYLVTRGFSFSLVGRLAATYTIAGSNDGSTWVNLHDASFTAAPVTYTSGASSYASQLTSIYQVSTATAGSTNAQNSNNNITGYANQTGSYTYFRFITKSGLQGKFGTSTTEQSLVDFYWNPYFTPAASSVSMALDNGLPNQLNVGGAMSVAGTLYRPNIPYLFRSHSVGQAFTTGSAFTVLFDTIQKVGLDVGLSYSAGVFSNITSYTIYYNVSSNMNWGPANTAGVRELYLRHSTMGTLNFMDTAPASYPLTSATTNAIFPLAPGEYFYVVAFQNSGSTLNSVTETQYYSRITITCLNM
jgi:hypothetical protein